MFAAATATVLSGASFIATAQQPPAASPASLEEITVTGTRIRRDGYNAPTPTTVVDNQYMESLGLVNVADLVTQIPSNISNFQPENTGGSAFFIGSTLANLRGLNPFFGTRTLTLVDSKRHVPTNNGNSVDLNAIPGVLIDRMEVVTGGASATYGSDAVTGVVNILLDKDLQGHQARSRLRLVGRRRRKPAYRRSPEARSCSTAAATSWRVRSTRHRIRF